MSSRKLLTLLDGLPADSWYKLSVHQFIEETAEETERTYGDEVRGHIFAQLSGQTFETATQTTE